MIGLGSDKNNMNCCTLTISHFIFTWQQKTLLSSSRRMMRNKSDAADIGAQIPQIRKLEIWDNRYLKALAPPQASQKSGQNRVSVQLNCTPVLTPRHKEMRIAKLNCCWTDLIDVDRKQESLTRNENIQRRPFSKVHKLLLSFLSDNVLNTFLIGKTAFDQIRSRFLEANEM